MAIAKVERKQNAQTIKSTIRAITVKDSLEVANKPRLKTPICYSSNQVEILQTLGNYTWAAHFEADQFFQKFLTLMKILDTTKINRLPALWRNNFCNISRDIMDYLHMEEPLVAQKSLRPIILRRLRFGHPGRYSLLATVASVW